MVGLVHLRSGSILKSLRRCLIRLLRAVGKFPSWSRGRLVVVLLVMNPLLMMIALLISLLVLVILLPLLLDVLLL